MIRNILKSCKIPFSFGVLHTYLTIIKSPKYKWIFCLPPEGNFPISKAAKLGKCFQVAMNQNKIGTWQSFELGNYLKLKNLLLFEAAFSFHHLREGFQSKKRGNLGNGLKW